MCVSVPHTLNQPSSSSSGTYYRNSGRCLEAGVEESFKSSDTARVSEIRLLMLGSRSTRLLISPLPFTCIRAYLRPLEAIGDALLCVATAKDGLGHAFAGDGRPLSG